VRATVTTRVEREPAADEQRPLPHAAEPGGVVRQHVGKSATVIADDELDGVRGRVQRHDQLRRSRVTQRVRDGLLGDSVDDQLDFRAQCRQAALQLVGDP